MKDIIRQVCTQCGVSANVLTALKKYKARPEILQYDVSTWRREECDFCGETKPVTEVRDFFYPDFYLLHIKLK